MLLDQKPEPVRADLRRRSLAQESQPQSPLDCCRNLRPTAVLEFIVASVLPTLAAKRHAREFHVSLPTFPANRDRTPENIGVSRGALGSRHAPVIDKRYP